MLIIITATRKLVNWKVWSSGKKNYYLTEEAADRYAETDFIKRNGGFEVTVLKKKPSDVIPVKRPALQELFEKASPEEKDAFKRYNDMVDGAQALRLSQIDLGREFEGWLRNLRSANSRKSYKSGVKKFIRYCEERKFTPLMIGVSEAREFRNYLGETGVSNSTIRSALISCSRLFDRIFESHDFNRLNPFKATDLLPPKERVKPLWVPNQEAVDKILVFTRTNLEVFTAIRLIIKHGMRIGAFSPMTVASDGKAVTFEKGKRRVYNFDDDDLNLWRACPLNKFSERELADRVNYHLKRAFEEKEVSHRYSAHKLRHFFAQKRHKELGGDVHKVSRELGHSNIGTTGTYLETLDREALSGDEV